MKRIIQISLSVSLLFQAQQSYAWPPTFGAEFNFSNRTIVSGADRQYVNSEAAVEAQKKMRDLIVDSCIVKKCKVTTLKNGYDVPVYRVTYEDGWWFQIATDPSVVEVQTKASTIEELKANEQRIQTDIFDSAAAVELKPASDIFGRGWAGGHFHVGLKSSVNDNVLFFRNVMVDFVNHPELANGIFSNDMSNAPPVAALPQENRDNFTKMIENFDKKFQNNKTKPTINQLAKQLNQTVYFSTPSGWGPPQKYQAFNVTRVGNGDFDISEQTFEIRGSRPQSSASEYIAQVELTEQRLRTLRFKRKPIPLHIPEVTRNTDYVAFYDYVFATGLDFKNYEQFLTPSQNALLQSQLAARPQKAQPVRRNLCDLALEK